MPSQYLGDLALNGIAAAPSGTARFYQPNTLTPVTVYSNDAATTAITQPVQLDANGRSTVPVYLTAPARMIVQSVSGATVLDVERVDGLRAETTALVNPRWPNEKSVDAMATALAVSLGGPDGQFQASGTGALARPVQTKLSEQLSVKDFGAKGDGITDDTAAITAAVTAANALGGGLIFFPAGTYLISQPISLTHSNILLQGVGQTASVIVNSSSTGNAFNLGVVSNITFASLGITAATSSSGSAISASGSTCTYVALNNCVVAGHHTGLTVVNSVTALSIIGSVVATDGSAGSGCVSINQGVQVKIFASNLNTATTAGATFGISIGTGDVTVMACNMTATTGVVTNGAAVTILGGSDGFSNLINLYQVTGGAPIINALSPPGAGNPPQNIARSTVLSPYTCGAYADSGPFLVQQVINSSTVNVVPLSYRYTRFRATVAAITVNVQAPLANTIYVGAVHTIICANNSGGAVTWTFSGSYEVAATAPPNGFQIAITCLCIDTNTPVFTEIARSSAVASV